MKKRYTEEQIIGAIKEHEAGAKVDDICRSLNSVIRKAVSKRKLFPTDDAAMKVVYLAIREASKKWTMPIRN